MRRIAIVVALGLSLPGKAPAQEAVEIGDRVRVTLLDRTSPIIGTIAVKTPVQLVLKVEDYRDSIVLPLGAVERIDVSRGRHATWRGVLTYGAVGGAFGVISGALAGPLVMNSGCVAARKTPENVGGCLAGLADGGQRATAAVVGGVSGAIIGSLVALIVGTERWDAIDPAGFPVRVALSDLDRVTVRMSLAF